MRKVVTLLSLASLAVVAGFAVVLKRKESNMPGQTGAGRAHEKRARVIAYAASQLGTSDPSLYWKEVLGSVPDSSISWCGAFALWVLRQALRIDWPWIPSKGFLFVDNDGNSLRVPRLPIVKVPSIGDVAYYDKPYQHYALVEEVEGDKVHLIAGNTPDVSRYTEPLSKATAYFSLAPLL